MISINCYYSYGDIGPYRSLTGRHSFGEEKSCIADCGAPLDGRFNRTTNKGGKRMTRAASPSRENPFLQVRKALRVRFVGFELNRQ